MIVFALLRGNIGTDTPSYITAIEILRDNGKDALNLFEPLFEWLLNNLAQLPIPAWSVLALISLLTTVLFIFGWVRIEPSLVVFTGVYAQFFVDMTMNGIRYGLAFALIVFASRFLLDKRFNLFWGIALAAAFIQISSVLLTTLLFLLHERRWRSIIYTAGIVCLIAVSFNERLLFKLAIYELEKSPNSFSGILPLISTFSILLFWIFDSGARYRATIAILSLTSLAIAAYVLTQITYAGLRFQLLLQFLTALVFTCHLHVRNIQLKRRSVFGLIIIGILLGGMKLRHFSADVEDAAANYIPYKFFWEE